MSQNPPNPTPPPHAASKVWAVVVAAGISTRLRAARPKQYLVLHGQPILHHTLTRLCRSPVVDGVVVGLHPQDQWWATASFTHAKLLGSYHGGATRAATVQNGLAYLRTHAAVAANDWVLVHDAVRPVLVQRDLVNVVAAARASACGAVLGEVVMDTLKIADDAGQVQTTVPRAAHWRAYTPQIFPLATLATALSTALATAAAHAHAAQAPLTDESMAMEQMGIHAPLVRGHPANLKITTPADLPLAALYLEAFQ